MIPIMLRAEQHIFSLPDGRALEAKIVSYDDKSGRVTLERQDGKRIKIRPSGFVKADQKYIMDWVSAHAFLSDRTLKVECDDRVDKEWKEKETMVLLYATGEIEDNAFVHNVIQYRQVAYDFTFENKGSIPISGLTLQYCIYYEQSSMTCSNKPSSEVNTLYGSMKLPDLPPGKRTTVSTKPVTVYDDDLSAIPQRGGDQRLAGEGEVLGMHARLVMKKEAEEITRYVEGPGALSEDKYPWTEKSNAAERKPSITWSPF